MTNSPLLDFPLPDIVGSSLAMREVYRRTRLVAPSRASVLIVGETGTGKELIARSLHRLSPRADGPYVRVNCGALSESLLESELFGHIKGRSTAPLTTRPGGSEPPTAAPSSLAKLRGMAPSPRSSCLESSKSGKWKQ